MKEILFDTLGIKQSIKVHLDNTSASTKLYVFCPHCDRLARKIRKLRYKMWGDPPGLMSLAAKIWLWPKPHGMWWRTYQHNMDMMTDWSGNEIYQNGKTLPLKRLKRNIAMVDDEHGGLTPLTGHERCQVAKWCTQSEYLELYVSHFAGTKTSF